MKIQRFLVVGAVALSILLFAPSARANDHHRRHGGDRHEYRHYDHGYYARPYSYGYVPGYYSARSTVIYDEPYFPDRYYGGPSYGLSFAFGGHDRRGYRHYRH